jgi:ATPase family AAA domain-containing protein 3A/B
MQEVTKQKEHEMQRAQFKAHEQQLAMQRAKEEEQIAFRTLERQTDQEKKRVDYADQLERKRMVDKINAQRQIADEERKKQEDSLKRQEDMRRKTLEYESELRQRTEMARIKAETEGKIRQERENHDLVLEKSKQDASEYRETVLKSISLAGDTLGAGFKDFVTDRDKLVNVAVTVTCLSFGVYAAKVSTGIAGRFVEARLGKPTLVRETTKMNVLQMVRHPFKSTKLAFGSNNATAAMDGIVLENTLDNRLRRVAGSTANTKKNNAPFRHILLHGPPGTGKTMFAKGLAHQSGLHYAIMTGGDVAPLGKDAVTEIHKIFDWANTTNKGVLLFVDEADAFLRKRSTEKISEDMRNALNAFLYRTGEASKKIMIVYASNQPEQFDWAINDRIDEMVEFRLPRFDERIKMITQYMDRFLLNPPAGSKRINVVEIDEASITAVAEQTVGFSGREISKLAIAWQAAAYGTANATFDKELMMEVLLENISSKVQKQGWLSKEEAEHFVRDNNDMGGK